MALRDFCIALFHQDIAPAIERRIQGLTRLVSDARKGVKNVIKSFWRKPREEVAQQKGAIKYRFDRIEAQILLLADSCFIIRVTKFIFFLFNLIGKLQDYDTAVAMYKLVRDDFRADKVRYKVLWRHFDSLFRAVIFASCSLWPHVCLGMLAHGPWPKRFTCSLGGCWLDSSIYV